LRQKIYLPLELLSECKKRWEWKLVRVLAGLLASLKMGVEEVHESSQRNGKGAVGSIFL